jgi:hypothetical protein
LSRTYDLAVGNESSQSTPLESLIKEAKRVEEDSIHSAKGHFEAAAAWDKWHLWIGGPTVVIATVAGLTALNNKPIIGGVLALLAAASSAVFTFLNPKERAAVHLKAGNAYKALNNDARIFCQIECQQEASDPPLIDKLKSLNDRRNALNAESPQPPPFAFRRAKAGIDAGEASYAADKARRKKPPPQSTDNASGSASPG